MSIRTDPVRIALVGCGEVTEHKHLPALSRLKDVRVVALADIDEGRREAVGDRFQIHTRVPNVEALLALPDLDAVGVCVPPGAHAATASLPIGAGLHVWIDKPLALTIQDCVQVIQAARCSRSQVMVGFHMRWHRLVSEARRIIRSGRLGPVESIRVVWNSPRSDRGLPEWRRNRETGGGALTEIGVHAYDLWRFLLDGEVEEVFARSRDGSREDESAIVSGRMNNGALCTAILSERTSHEIEIEVCGADGRLRVDCLRFEGLDHYSHDDVPGRLVTRLRRFGHLLREAPTGLSSRPSKSDHLDSYRRAWKHFLDAIRAGHPVESTLQDGLRAVEVIRAAAESRRRGTVVPVSLTVAGTGEKEAVRAVQTAAGEPKQADTSPLFSVVVPTHNRPGQLADLLQSLANQRYARDRFEVILVDDGSTTPAQEALARFSDRIQIRLLLRMHGGPAKARQEGVAVARGRFLAFTDDDCRPAPDWLAQAEEACRDHPECAVIGTVINGLPGNAYSEASQMVISYLYSHFNTDRESARFGCTSNVVFPARQFGTVGGLDTGWSISGGEDRDLSHRWLRHGFRMIWSEQLIVHHCHHLSFRSFWRQHFHYGRGGFVFRSGCSGGNLLRLPFETLGFYARLPLFPLNLFPWRRAIPLSGLLVVSQAANAAGFLRQWLAAIARRARRGLSRIARSGTRDCPLPYELPIGPKSTNGAGQA